MKNLKLLIGLLVGAEVYCYLMWYQSLGINALIFAALLIGTVFGIKKELRANKQLKGIAAAFLLSALGVAINGNTFSEIIYYLSLLTFLSFVQLPRLRVLCFAGLTFQINFVMGIGHNYILVRETIKEVFLSGKNGERKKNRLMKMVRLATILALFTVFLMIFSTANPQFRKICDHLLAPIANLLEQLFQNIRIENIIHYLFIFYFLSLFLVRFKDNLVSQWEASLGENLVRRRKPTNSPHLQMNLKDEYKTAKWSIIVLNLLLMLVNLTDIFSVWLGFVPDSPSELSAFVHNGTYSLIFSVVLSIIILLLVFRDNLNLYPDNQKLRKLANVWILQNVFLLLSVGLRNIHYILECGLTYKRIGVFMFLVATFVLLYFLYVKIRNRKTFIYYLKTTNFGIGAMLVVVGLVNWDLVIGGYNNYYGKTDIQYIKNNLSEQAGVFIPKELRKDDYTYDLYIEKKQNACWQSFSWFDYWAANRLSEK